MKYGLIGGALSHSFSKPIHEKLAGYTYNLFPLDENEFDAFMQKRDFDAINVTIPYKQRVMDYCDEIDEKARAIGAVNTIVNRNGRLYAYNTDFDGFLYLLRSNGVALSGKTVLILGNGGTTRTMRAVAASEGAGRILVASRRAGPGVVLYQEALAQKDVQVVLNASPVGMYPNAEASPIDLAAFPQLEAVFDAVYNPLRTRLLQQAAQLGAVAAGGLGMLVAQAKYAAELFTGRPIPEEAIARVEAEILCEKTSIALVGMPGCGKTGLGKRLAKRLGRRFVDVDHEVVKTAGKSIPEIFAQDGEEAFRRLEDEAVAGLAAQNGLVIATGGGTVKRQRNLANLRQNGVLLFIDCPVESLAISGGRPLAKSREDLYALAEERLPLYRAAADAAIDYHFSIDENVNRLYRAYCSLQKCTKKRL